MKSQSYDTFQYVLLVNNFKPIIILEPGQGGGKACMQTSQCLSYRSLLERKEGLDAFKTSWNKSGRSRMGRRRRRMIMIRRRWREIGGMRRKCRRAWWWSNAPWSLLTLVSYPYSSSSKVLFHQPEVKQPHRSDTQKPNNMNYLVPPEAPDHPALLFARTAQPLWSELLKKVQPV